MKLFVDFQELFVIECREALKGKLDKLTKEDATSWAGNLVMDRNSEWEFKGFQFSSLVHTRIGPLDIDSFKTSMKQCGEYTCTVKLDAFPEWLAVHACVVFPQLGLISAVRVLCKPRLAFAHPTIRPSIGSIKRVAERFFFVDKWSARHGWPAAISCRAHSQTCPPQSYELLNGDVLLHAFLYAFKESVKEGSEVKSFENAMKCVKVVFHLCPKPLDAERKKWELEGSLECLAEERLLIGWGQVVGVCRLQEMLGTPSNPASADVVAEFLSKGKIKSIRKEAVLTMLKVRKRYTAACVALWLSNLMFWVPF